MDRGLAVKDLTMRLFTNIIQVTKLDYFGVPYDTSIEEPPATRTRGELWKSWRDTRLDNDKYMNDHVYGKPGTQQLPVDKIELYHELLLINPIT